MGIEHGGPTPEEMGISQERTLDQTIEDGLRHSLALIEQINSEKDPGRKKELLSGLAGTLDASSQYVKKVQNFLE